MVNGYWTAQKVLQIGVTIYKYLGYDSRTEHSRFVIQYHMELGLKNREYLGIVAGRPLATIQMKVAAALDSEISKQTIWAMKIFVAETE